MEEKDICDMCGINVCGLGERFTCKYCGKTNCNKHRLPEQHNCKFPKNPHSETKDIFNKYKRGMKQ